MNALHHYTHKHAAGLARRAVEVSTQVVSKLARAI
jgi:hypothetical protein